MVSAPGVLLSDLPSETEDRLSLNLDFVKHRRLAVKALVESLPEVTFTCSDSEHQFTLGIMIRFHRLGGDKMSDLEEEQYLVPCVVTMEKDWSQVIDVQVGSTKFWTGVSKRVNDSC